LPAIIVLVVLLVIGLIVYGWYAAEQRKKLLHTWARTHGLRFDPEKRYGLDDRFGEFDCLSEGRNRHAFNVSEGDWRGREILAFDYHYETQSTNSKGRTSTTNHYFSAVILFCDVPLKPLFIRPEGFFDKITQFFGYDDIDFESAEFSRKFYVKSPDKRWAYDVIHQGVMELLLDGPVFTMKFGPNCAVAYRSSTFKPQEFASAAELIRGVFDRFPEYLIRQQREGGPQTNATT